MSTVTTDGTPGPSWAGLVWMTLPLLICIVVLAWRRLGQVRPLVISSVRMVVQLMLLGLVLGTIFEAKNPWIVLAVALLMLLASAHAVGARQARSGWTLQLESFGVMGLSMGLVMALATRLALEVEPWYEPSTIIPLAGMILGNSVNGVALAAERLDGELRTNRDLVELRLTLGATKSQAAQPELRAAVHAALTPTINSMMIAGIVAIPGMATGQILAGADVGTALRYQVLIYLAIAATVVTSTLLLLALRLRHYFTASHQLRAEVFQPPSG